MNNKRFNRLVEIARALYTPFHSSRCWHATFIIKKGKILSIGVNNSNKGHRRNLELDYYTKNGLDLRDEVGIHSELAAVIKGGREDYSDCNFVNIRIGRDGKLKNSRCCNGCKSLLQQVGYKRLFWTTDSQEFLTE